ncbi:hypothetical protein PENSPDRAFT_291409 [Peniophora sp. CONT]|nr:hypothetical protein PENSPDRAFT_291409 [Peniophora sp. CONT]
MQIASTRQSVLLRSCRRVSLVSSEWSPINVFRFNQRLGHGSGTAPIRLHSTSSVSSRTKGLKDKDRQCLDCGRSQSKHQWHRHSEVSGAYRCNTCYVRTLREADKKAHLTCLECGTNVSSVWYTHPSGKSKSCCHACRRRGWLLRSLKDGRTCSDCGRKDASNWYPVHGQDDAFKCNRCYMRDKVERVSREGVSCVECGTNKSSNWTRHPAIAGAYQCSPCYFRSWRAKKRQSTQPPVRDN